MIEAVIAWVCVVVGCIAWDPQWFLAAALFAVAANIRERKENDK